MKARIYERRSEEKKANSSFFLKKKSLYSIKFLGSADQENKKRKEVQLNKNKMLKEGEVGCEREME